MSIKVTEKAVRELVRSLLEQDINPRPVDGSSMAQLPIEPDPVLSQEDLGPPVQDINYEPANHDELMNAVEILLADVPKNLVPAVFKAVRKLVDKALRLAKERAEQNPQDIVSEKVNVLPLLEAIVEQNLPYTVDIDAAKGVGYDDPDLEKIKMKGEEEDEEDEEGEDPVDSDTPPEKPKAPQPPGRRIYAVVPPKSTAKSYSGQADEVEDEAEIDPGLAKMLGDQPRRMTARDREQARKAKEDAAQKSAEQSQVASAMAEKAAEEKLKIAKLLYKDDKALSNKLDNLEDAMMLDSLLTPDQVFEVEEEFVATDTAEEIKSGGARSFSDMSDEQRGKFAKILLDTGKELSKSALRNIQDAGFMKFLHALTIGPDKFQEELLSITEKVPEDATPIQKFILKHVPWSAEFKKASKVEVDELDAQGNPVLDKDGKPRKKKVIRIPEFDPEGVSDILNHLRQNSEGAKEGGTLLDDYTSLVHYYIAFRDDFPGARKGGMRKFHFNKDNGQAALERAVKGLSDRGDKKSYDELVRILNIDSNKKEISKMLGKDFVLPKFESPQED